MPIHIDHMSTTVELTEPRGTAAAPMTAPTPPSTGGLHPATVRQVQDAALQALADRFELYLRTRGI